MSDKRTLIKNTLLAAVPTVFASRLLASSPEDLGQNKILAIVTAKIEQLKRLAAVDGTEGLLKIGSVASTKVAVYLGADQQVANDVQTVIQFDAEEVDYLNEYNTTNGRFTALRAGIYQVSYSVRIENAEPQSQSIINLRKNGQSGTWIDAGSANQAVRGYHYLTASGNIALAAGDRLDIILAHFNGSAKNVRGRLSITRLV